MARARAGEPAGPAGDRGGEWRGWRQALGQVNLAQGKCGGLCFPSGRMEGGLEVGAWGGGGFVPEPQPGSLCWGHRLCGGASGLGTPWPGLLTWMGWGSVPSWLQRAARGRPKRAPLPPDPDSPGASAAAEVPRRAKGQGSPLLLLRVPPAAKEKRAKSHGGEAPGERSRTLSALSPRC